MESKSRKVNNKFWSPNKTEEYTDGTMLFSFTICVYILCNLLQEVLNFFGLAHNGMFTAVLFCLDFSSYLYVILLYCQMSKNLVFRGCSCNCLSKWCMFFSKIFMYLNAKGKIIYIFMTLSNILCTCWRNSFAGRQGHKLHFYCIKCMICCCKWSSAFLGCHRNFNLNINSHNVVSCVEILISVHISYKQYPFNSLEWAWALS